MNHVQLRQFRYELHLLQSYTDCCSFVYQLFIQQIHSGRKSSGSHAPSVRYRALE